MRAYFFGNMYLSSIQQGIQAGHVIGEMAIKYQRTGDGFTTIGHMFSDWADNHKTMILLNGGYSENLHDLYDFIQVGNANDLTETIESDENPYPYAKFHESKEALDGALTSVGIVLPAKIYNGAQAMRKIKRRRMDDPVRMAWDLQQVLDVDLGGDKLEGVAFTNFEVELMTRLGSFRMAS